MTDSLEGKKILITGGAGSVGRALAARVLAHNPQTVRVLDISENEMFDMRTAFGANGKLRYLIGDIRDVDRVRMAMEGIDIVFHLAAMKHVYACEYNPFEAVKTNIQGLQNVIDVSREVAVEKMIFSSTDKAANPLSVMGTTKRLGEKLVSLANFYKGDRRTVFASVRFGNVVGSNGSVVPLFKKQIAAGGPITITDEGMTRFIVTMDQAVDLIFAAHRLARGGEVFVLKMKTLTIVDLADAMIKKYAGGKAVDRTLIGKFEGEKLHEDIMSDDEVPFSVELEDLYAILPVIDHVNVAKVYGDRPVPQNPVIRSDMGQHEGEAALLELLERLDAAEAGGA